MHLFQPVSIKRKIPFGEFHSPDLADVTDAPLITKIEHTPTFSSGRPLSTRRSLTKLRRYEEVGHLGEPPPLSEERERVRRETEVGYDDLGNETSHTTSTFDVSLNASSETLVERVTRTTTYKNVLTDWLISLPDRRTTRFETRAAPYDSCTTFPCDVATQTVDHVYDSEGLLRDLIREPTGDPSQRLALTLSRDPAGLVRTITLRDSTGSASSTQRSTEIDYDAAGHHQRVTKNAEGHISWFLCDQRLDRVLVETDPNGVNMYAQYDNFGRLRQLRDDRGPIKKLSYGIGHVREEDVGGAKHTQFFDPAGRPEVSVWTTLTGAGAAQNTYDVLGNVVESRYMGTTEAYSTVSGSNTGAKQRIAFTTSHVTATAKFDARGRPVFARTGGELPVVTTYKGLGQLWVEQGSGSTSHQRKILLSATGSVREVLDKLVVGSGVERWLSTKYEYDALGLTAKVTDPANQIDRFTYDRLGRQTSRFAPAWMTQATSWTYSAFGDIVGYRDAQHDFTFAYDRLGRLDRRLYTNGSLIADLTWDQGTGAIGKLSRALGPTGYDVSYTYDTRGRPSGEIHRIGQVRLSTVRTYDANGRVDTLQYPETATTDAPLGARGPGLKLKYLYSNGQTAQIQDVTSSTPATLWTVTERHPLGMLQKATEGPRSATWLYNNDSLRLESIRGSGFTTAPLNVSMQYGPTGMLQSRTLPTVVETFDHDTLKRLWRYQRISNASSSQMLAGAEYSYDDAGNVTRADATQSHQSPDWPLTDYDYVYSSAFPQRLTQLRASTGQTRELRYDSAGRQTEDQPNLQSPAFRRIAYNHDNLPTRIEQMSNATTPDPNQTATTFDYDAFGARVRKTRGQDVVLYVGGLYTRTPQQTVYFIASEDGPVVELRRFASGGSAPLYAYVDHLGSRVAYTAGGVPMHSGFFPYGQRWHNGTAPTSVFSLGFTGHEHDDDLGLINMQGRIYDSTQSRFLTPDPKVLPSAPGGMNPYAYALNSPANYNDPTGFQVSGAPTNFVPLQEQVIAGSLAEAAAYQAQQQAMQQAMQQAAQQAQQQAMQAQQEQQQRIAQEQALRGLGVPSQALPGMTFTGALRLAQRALASALIDRDRFDGNRRAMVEQFGGPEPGVAPISGALDGVVLEGPPRALDLFSIFVMSAKTGPGGLMPIVKAGNREMLYQAVQQVKASSGSAAQKAEMFQQLAGQVAQLSGGSWRALRGVGSDGSHVFMGGAGEAVVISPAGQLFRGALQTGGVSPTGPGRFLVDYAQLRPL
jgi:RHS repeat-associated protein